MFGAKRARVFQRETDVGKFGEKPGKEGGERLCVVWEVVVAPPLVVTEITDLAELELSIITLLLLRHLLRSVAVEIRFRVPDSRHCYTDNKTLQGASPFLVFMAPTAKTRRFALQRSVLVFPFLTSLGFSPFLIED